MKYHVTHRTPYVYDDEVTDSLGIAFLTPRSLRWQQVDGVKITVDPLPSDMSNDIDYYGNTVTYFQVTTTHTQLNVEAVSEVEGEAPVYEPEPMSQPWERARPLIDPTLPGAWRAVDAAVESAMAQHTDEAYFYGDVSFTPGRSLVDVVTDLMHRIHADFRYDKEATNVSSTVHEIFDAKGGVCQDFAHLMLACLRSHGLAARYVSGYLLTTPPPGKDRVVGADASHAWVAVWVPALTPNGTDQWIALDPTNDVWADDRYVWVSWGRDYSDVPPVKGVIFTDAKHSTLDVSVDVAPVAVY